MLYEIRFALRGLSKRPGLTIAAVLTLALAIGATTTIFSVVDAVIVRPLPFAEPHQLVQVFETTPQGADFSASDPDYLDFTSQNRSLSGIGAFKPGEFALTGDGEPKQLHGMATTANLFPLLGVHFALGRAFRPDEDAPGDSSHVVILSHALWSGRFGADSSVVGRPVMLNARPYTVVGVLPEHYHFPEGDVFVPLHANSNSRRDDHWLSLVGRMKPGVTVAQAQRDFDRITAGIGATYPMSKGWGARLQPLSHVLVDDNFRRAGWVLLAATGLLLVLACANVANLLLARASTRQTEMGLRTAIGATRRRLVRQLLTESGVLVSLAAVAGVTATFWGLSAIHAIGAGRIPRLEEVSVDRPAIAMALLLTVVTTFACGLVPALRASRVEPAAVLGDGVRGGISRGHRRQRDVLVVFQVALSIVLLIGAGLMLRSFGHLSSVDTGFDAQRVLAVTLNLPDQRYDEQARVVFFSRLTASLRGLPGVRAAGAGAVDPFSGWNYMNDVTPVDRAASAPSAGFMQAGWRSVTPGFFDAMGIPLSRGRVFSGSDPWNGPAIVVVSRSFAQKMWPGQDAVGKRLYWGGTSGTARTVVGVVGDVRDIAPQTEPQPTLYVPYNQLPMAGMTLVVRASGGDPAVLAASVRGAIHALDPALPVADVHPLARNRRDAMTAPRFNLVLMASFAALALLLAAGGISSVMAFTVAQRRREIGIRLVLGAAPRGIVRAFVMRAMQLTALGVVVGLLGGLAAGRVMSSLLFEVAPTDPLTFVAVPALLVLVALAASYLPARQANAVALMEVLGRE
ncbi:MAG TPA: ABC transporter permease [Gemmatimonadaceae bacterium]|nr:ABC transporter permease [Gemmatimonadaceae bacterium]